MRVISRYSTQLKAEAGLRYRGAGEVVYLESPDYPKHGWALVDQYEPKPFPPRASSGTSAANAAPESARPEGVPGAFVCREEDIG